MRTWEYRTTGPFADAKGGQNKALSELGAEGWELVAVAVSQGFQTLYWRRETTVWPRVGSAHGEVGVVPLSAQVGPVLSPEVQFAMRRIAQAEIEDAARRGIIKS